MTVPIDAELVRRVALLSRLELTDQEVALFSGQLRAIVDYIKKMNELDVCAVEPLAHCLPLENVFREDVAGESLPTEQALANAPDSQDGFFKVPKILEDSDGA